MFVKVDEGSATATLFEVPPGSHGLQYGSEFVRRPPSEIEDWEPILKSFDYLYTFITENVTPLEPAPSPDGEHFQPYWPVHWAKWYDEPFGQSIGIVTTNDIYILNSKGKTVESLRRRTD